MVYCIEKECIVSLPLVNEAELMEWLDFHQSSALKRCLEQNGIHYVIGRNGQVSTTLDAINTAMGLNEDHIENIKIEF